MKKYVVIYGGTQLSEPIASFVKDLSYSLLEGLKVVLVTGGFNYFKKDPTTVSTDVSVLKGARIFAKEKNIPLSDVFETWLPDTKKDRNKEGVVRFHDEGNVKELKGESAQARRFSMVRDSNVLITVMGKINTALVLDFALTINKPALPLSFTGGDSLDYWKANKDRIKQWFGIDETLANELEIADIENFSLTKRKDFIDKIVIAVEAGLTCEKINDSKYKIHQKNWELNTNENMNSITDLPNLSGDNGIKKGNSNDVKANVQAKFFLSYSHKDEQLKEQLDIHLTALKRSNQISVWNDRKIEGGTNWDKAIKDQLEGTDFILFLLSANFLASAYIWDTEVKLALQRQEQNKAKVIPIFLRKCDFKDTPFENLQGYPVFFKLQKIINGDGLISEEFFEDRCPLKVF